MKGRQSIGSGRLKVAVGGGEARGLAFDGVELLRGLSAPVRDADWATLETRIDAEDVGPDHYHCAFSTPDGVLVGDLQIRIDGETRCTATVTLSFTQPSTLNRAGFCLLHPIRGVGGSEMTVTHPDGSRTVTTFPSLISPCQPARNIAALAHSVGPVDVAMNFEGEVFEMEDQRNWSDASFKTYCRPLGLPRPFAVAADEVIRQQIVIDITCPARAAAPAATPEIRPVVMPQVFLAHEPGLSSLAGLTRFEGVPVLARIDVATGGDELVGLADRALALELVIDRLDEIALMAGRIRAAGLIPLRVTCLPRGYLKSHQPEGPWPDGPTPADCLTALRHAFPGVQIGGGSLTNFTEFNRCRPGRDADFLTFGNTAIVHTADDLSVCQTLEALPDIFASARAIQPDKPLQLGLFSIGMRANPYGRDVLANPLGKRIAMARRDPRQDGPFAAAYAVGVLALAALDGVESIALAMPDGDLGAADRPVSEVIRAAHALAGKPARAEATNGIYRIHSGATTLIANLSGTDLALNCADPLPHGHVHIGGNPT